MDLLVEGRYAALMVTKPHTGADLVSWVWGSYFIGSLAATWAVGPLGTAYTETGEVRGVGLPALGRPRDCSLQCVLGGSLVGHSGCPSLLLLLPPVGRVSTVGWAVCGVGFQGRDLVAASNRYRQNKTDGDRR